MAFVDGSSLAVQCSGRRVGVGVGEAQGRNRLRLDELGLAEDAGLLGVVLVGSDAGATEKRIGESETARVAAVGLPRLRGSIEARFSGGS